MTNDSLRAAGIPKEMLLKWQFALLLGFVASLWWRQDFSHILLITVLFLSLFVWSFQVFKERLIPIFVLSQLYLVALFSYFYSTDQKEALFVLEKQLTIFLLPVIFGGAIRIKASQIQYLFSVFTFSVSLACGYLLCLFWLEYKTGQTNAAFGDFLNQHLHHAFSLPLKLHATFLSMYVCFAILISVHRSYNERGWMRWLSVLTLPVLLVSLILLSSRIIFVPFFIAMIFVLPFFLKKWGLVFHLVVLSLLIIYGISFLGSFTALKERFGNDTLRELNLSVESGNFTTFDTIRTNDATRAERWNCSVELIRERPLLGYGTGDEKKMLNVKYQKYHLSNSISNNFDAHNQYLAFFIKSGLLGFLSFVGLLIWCLQKAIRTRNYYFICFLMIIAFTSLTENILESNKGILFFAFFASIFGFYEPPTVLKNN